MDNCLVPTFKKSFHLTLIYWRLGDSFLYGLPLCACVNVYRSLMPCMPVVLLYAFLGPSSHLHKIMSLFLHESARTSIIIFSKSATLVIVNCDPCYWSSLTIVDTQKMFLWREYNMKILQSHQSLIIQKTLLVSTNCIKLNRNEMITTYPFFRIISQRDDWHIQFICIHHHHRQPIRERNTTFHIIILNMYSYISLWPYLYYLVRLCYMMKAFVPSFTSYIHHNA